MNGLAFLDFKYSSDFSCQDLLNVSGLSGANDLMTANNPTPATRPATVPQKILFFSPGRYKGFLGPHSPKEM